MLYYYTYSSTENEQNVQIACAIDIFISMESCAYQIVALDERSQNHPGIDIPG